MMIRNNRKNNSLLENSVSDEIQTLSRYQNLENILNIKKTINPGETTANVELNNIKYSDYLVVNPSVTQFWNIDNVSEELKNNVISGGTSVNQASVNSINQPFVDTLNANTDYGTFTNVDPNTSIISNFTFQTLEDNQATPITPEETNFLNTFKSQRIEYSNSSVQRNNYLNLNYFGDYGLTNSSANLNVMGGTFDRLYRNDSHRFICIVPKNNNNIKVIAVEYTYENIVYRNRLYNLISSNGTDIGLSILTGLTDLTNQLRSTVINYCVLPNCLFRVEFHCANNLNLTGILSDHVDIFYTNFRVDDSITKLVKNRYFLENKNFQPGSAVTSTQFLNAIPARHKLLYGLLIPFTSNYKQFQIDMVYDEITTNIEQWHYQHLKTSDLAETQGQNLYFFTNKSRGNSWTASGNNGSQKSIQYIWFICRQNDGNEFVFDVRKLAFRLILLGGEIIPQRGYLHPKPTFTGTTLMSQPLSLNVASRYRLTNDAINAGVKLTSITSTTNIITDQNLSLIFDIPFTDFLQRNIIISANSTRMFTFNFDILDFIQYESIYLFIQPAGQRFYPIFFGKRTIQFNIGTDLVNPNNVVYPINNGDRMRINLKFYKPIEPQWRVCGAGYSFGGLLTAGKIETLQSNNTTSIIPADATLFQYLILEGSNLDPAIKYLEIIPEPEYSLSPLIVPAVANIGLSLRVFNINSPIPKENIYLLRYLKTNGNFEGKILYTSSSIVDPTTYYYNFDFTQLNNLYNYKLGIQNYSTRPGSLPGMRLLTSNTILTIPTGWYTGTDGITELIRLLKTLTPNATYTFNKYTGKISYTSTSDYIINFSIKTSVDTETNSTLFGFSNVREFIQTTTAPITLPLEVDLFYNSRFSFININLLNFSNYGFVGESLSLIKLIAQNNKGQLSYTYLNNFEKTLPKNMVLSNLSITLTDGAGLEIKSKEPIYLEFLIKCYN